jgi:hypothetical protein
MPGPFRTILAMLDWFYPRHSRYKSHGSMAEAVALGSAGRLFPGGKGQGVKGWRSAPVCTPLLGGPILVASDTHSKNPFAGVP